MGETRRTGLDREVRAIGGRVRQLRKRLGLTVEQLASRAGVSAGMISQLERGIGNPALESLARLSQALSVPIVGLMLAADEQDRRVVRVDDRRLLEPLDPESERAGLVRELLTPSSTLPLQVIRTVMPAGFTNESRPFRHLGVECVVVLEGSLEVHHGSETVRLVQGDAMTYRCEEAHWWANPGDVEAVVLGSVTPQAP